MRRVDWGVFALVLVVLGWGVLDGSCRSPNQAPKPDPAVAAELKRLGAEVEDWKRRVDALELAQWEAKQEIVGIKADVAALSGRVTMIERVVPVQAIRDRARQR